MKNFLIFILLFYSSIFASQLKIQRTEGSSWEIYRVHLGEKEAIEPIAFHIQQGDQTLSLPPGKYYIANECSGQYFDIKENEDTLIQMHQLTLQLGKENKTFENDVVPTECIHPVHKKTHYWNSKYYFNFFSKANTLSISKKRIIWNSNSLDQIITLASLKVTSSLEHEDGFYSILYTTLDSHQKESTFIREAKIDKNTWLLPGHYTLDMNGSRTKIQLTTENNILIEAGNLLVEPPESFSQKERMIRGSEKLFAFLDQKVMLEIGKNHLIFPGKYFISLGKTELKKEIIIEPNSLSHIKTKSCVVTVGSCYKKPCEISKIFLHKENQTYIIDVIKPGVPFLIFDGSYQLSVEGARGLFKSLTGGVKDIEEITISEVHFQWKNIFEPGKNKTELARIEGKQNKISGETMDLLYNRPKYLYLPTGSYFFTYIYSLSNHERKKNQNTFEVTKEINHAITIPIYLSNTNFIESETLEEIETTQDFTVPEVSF